MEYLVIFLEGIITFISPCFLPMIPIYISFFMGNSSKNKYAVSIINALSFIFGFTIFFTLLGAMSASFGAFVKEYHNDINIILGAIVILFGLNFMEVLKIPLINKTKGIRINKKEANVMSSFLFGIIFSLTWSPCIGAFLGTALSIIVINGKIVKGILLILTYCLGLAIPIIVCTVLTDKLKNTFKYIKQNYNIINKICGIFLCIIGVLMMTGLIDRYFNLMM